MNHKTAFLLLAWSLFSQNISAAPLMCKDLFAQTGQENNNSGSNDNILEDLVFPDHSWYSHLNFDPLLGSNLNQLQIKETLNKTEAEVRRLNTDAILKLEAEKNIFLTDSRRSFLSLQEMNLLLKEIYNNEVASPYKTSQYAQPGTSIGYCFGRATYYHIALLKNKVHKSAIRKAFMVGPMTAFGNDWQFHVATVVKGPHDKWYALDPNFSSPQELSKWYETHFSMGQKKNVRLYITDPKKFTPTTDYDKLQMGLTLDREIDWYRGYFQDLMKSFRDQNAP